MSQTQRHQPENSI